MPYGLTSGAVSGVVARLEQTGRLRRVPHPNDGRVDAASLLEGFDADQLAAIVQFLERVTDYAYRRAAVLRAHRLLPSDRPPPAETSRKGST